MPIEKGNHIITIEKQPFGQTKAGEAVDLYIMKDGDFAVEIITYGASIKSIHVPVDGGTRDVALGFDDIAGYEENKAFHGATVGRYANRIRNACYEMNGETYHLDKNDDPHCIHGGFHGFNNQVWTAEIQGNALVMKLFDKEGSASGFPGNLEVTVKYKILWKNELVMEYTVKSDKETPINMTNHTYFNLAGHDSGSIENHKIQIHSDRVTTYDDDLITTGEFTDITGTPLDFRELTLIGPGFESDYPLIVSGGGYDHNWVLSDDCAGTAAVLECAGIKMICRTTKPGIQFYSGNMMQPETGKGGAKYSKRSGLCLETQYFPNSVNIPHFPAPLLKLDEEYAHFTSYIFEVI